MGAWHRAGIYKQRPVNVASVESIHQLHIVDIDANGNIRHKCHNENDTMLTTYDTTVSYIKAEPNELYPKAR